jgi:prepilin peptidase CpaA
VNTVTWMALGGLMAGAVATDLSERRILNPLIVVGLFLGVALSTMAAGLQGTIHSLAGAATGLALLLPFFCLRQVGAGDVKLLAVVGSFVGLPGVFWVALCTAIAGGVLAIAAHLSSGRLAFLPASRLPYSVAIAAGTAVWFISRT